MTAPQTAQDVPAMKAAQRKTASAVRAKVHDVCKQTAAAKLAHTGLDFLDIGPGTVVSGYFPYRSEIDVMPLMQRLACEGIALALPVVIGDGRPLIFRSWMPGDAMETGSMNIPVPVSDAAQVEPDVLLVPLLAFDGDGYRLGYGGGFYDRTLEKLRSLKPIEAVGVAYAGQAVDAVVRGIEDQPVDWMLTEDGPMRPGRTRSI